MYNRINMAYQGGSKKGKASSGTRKLPKTPPKGPGPKSMKRRRKLPKTKKRKLPKTPTEEQLARQRMRKVADRLEDVEEEMNRRIILASKEMGRSLKKVEKGSINALVAARKSLKKAAKM